VANWVEVADAAALNDGHALAVEVGERRYAVYRVGSEVFATDGVCSHAFALLGEGWLEGYEIECPLHGGKFCIRTGKALAIPAEVDIKSHPARIQDGKVLIDATGC
jgi:naphthalene 1,2-dioxygenase system ferredoxin subunit